MLIAYKYDAFVIVPGRFGIFRRPSGRTEHPLFEGLGAQQAGAPAAQPLHVPLQRGEAPPY